MKVLLSIWNLIWKTLAVAVALVVGAMGANQAGWGNAELFMNSSLMGPFEKFITAVFANIGLLIACGAAFFVKKIAKPVLWVMVPILLYSAVVLGVWNGFASDF